MTINSFNPNQELGNQNGGSQRIPVPLIWAVVVLSVAPFLLNLLGVDFGSTPMPLDRSAVMEMTGPQLTDAMHHALAGAFTHTLLEWSAFTVALFTVVFAFTHYRMKGDVTTPIIGVALFCAGTMDAFHTLAADRLIHASADNTNLIPFTWAICRLFNALIMTVGVGMFLIRGFNLRQEGLRFIVIISALFGITSYLLIHACATSSLLPQTMFPDSVFTRPYDVLPLVAFLALGLGLYPRFYKKHPNYFSHALIISVVPDIMTQAHMAFGSTALFDNHFNIAHFLKIITYLVPLLGLVLDYVGTYRSQQVALRKIQLTQEELQASERRTRLIVETALDAFIAMDADGRITDWNPQAETTFGWSRDEVLGRLLAKTIIPGQYRGAHRQGMKNFLATGEASRLINRIELMALRRDGRQFPVELTISPIRLKQGWVFNAFVHDISERKQAEDELHRAKHVAEEQARDLRYAQFAAEQASQAKSEFLANMSHELRTPMNSIIGFTERLLGKIGTSLSERNLDCLQTVDRNAKHLLGLINDILDFSKIEAGQMALKRSRFDLVAAISEVVERSRSLVDGQPIRLQVRLPETPIRIDADRVRVQQIVTNLLSNAVKYTNEGAVTISADELIDEQLGRCVLITIEDTGLGIKPQDLDRLFDKFTQVDGSSIQPGGGTGLGLAITDEFIRMHGGRIEVDSTYGQGSQFTVWLPLTVPDELSAKDETFTAPVECSFPHKGLHILCVDDDPDILKSLKLTFEDADYNVILASDYESAVEQIRLNLPDLICLDIGLPEKDGFEVLHLLRQDERLASVPVVVFSGKDVEAESLKAGARRFLSKPASSHELIEAVRDIFLGAVNEVLIVEDDRFAAQNVSSALSSAGIDVRVVENGQAGLRALSESIPSVIVLDLMMPVMDGFEFLRHVRKRPDWKRIPIVVLTAKDLQSYEVEVLSEVCDAILTKGRDQTEELIDAVLRAVNSQPCEVQAAAV